MAHKKVLRERNIMNDYKKILRKEVKQSILKLNSEYCEEANARIIDYIISWKEYVDADTVFCFVGTDTEINTTRILEHALRQGKRLGVPRCIQKGIMEVYEIKSLNDLEEGSYGILEPRAGTPLIRPEEIRLALVPCLTCNEKGQRLGYGGGFYDRYLARTDARRAVLCRSALIRESIPSDRYDLDMDYVITEKGIVSVS